MPIYKHMPGRFMHRSTPVDMSSCRWRCFAKWYPYQCSRKSVEELDGYGFCKQHAKMWRREQGSGN